jgi:hypothetical protein
MALLMLIRDCCKNNQVNHLVRPTGTVVTTLMGEGGWKGHSNNIFGVVVI